MHYVARFGDLVKVLWWDGDGLGLFAKRLERGSFIWPQAEKGVVSLSRAQLSMLLEGVDWRRPIRTAAPSFGYRTSLRKNVRESYLFGKLACSLSRLRSRA